MHNLIDDRQIFILQTFMDMGATSEEIIKEALLMRDNPGRIASQWKWIREALAAGEPVSEIF